MQTLLSQYLLCLCCYKLYCHGTHFIIGTARAPSVFAKFTLLPWNELREYQIEVLCPKIDVKQRSKKCLAAHRLFIWLVIARGIFCRKNHKEIYIDLRKLSGIILLMQHSYNINLCVNRDGRDCPFLLGPELATFDINEFVRSIDLYSFLVSINKHVSTTH